MDLASIDMDPMVGHPSVDISEYTKIIEKRIANPNFPETETSGLKPYEIMDIPVSPTQFPITFCYVYVDYGKEEWDEYVAYFLASIQYTYSDCGLSTIHYKVDFNGFIPARTQAYAKMRRNVRGNLIMLDLDVIAYQYCDPFIEDFDVGLTDSHYQRPLMPFNAGVMFFKDTPGAQKFLDLVMEISCNIPQGLDSWWVDQIAMRIAYEQLKGEVKFKIFPHELYNFTPENGVQATEAYFIHLKGDRKHMMRQYLACVIGTDHFELNSQKPTLEEIK